MYKLWQTTPVMLVSHGHEPCDDRRMVTTQTDLSKLLEIEICGAAGEASDEMIESAAELWEKGALHFEGDPGLSLEGIHDCAIAFPVTLREGEDGMVVSECVVLNGCISQGNSRAEALANMREAIVVSMADGRMGSAIARSRHVASTSIVQVSTKDPLAEMRSVLEGVLNIVKQLPCDLDEVLGAELYRRVLLALDCEEDIE